MATVERETHLTSVQQQIKRMNGDSYGPLGQAMHAWYLSLDNQKQAIIESQIVNLINNFHSESIQQFGVAAALECLGVMLLADPDCKLVNENWWIGRRCHG
jgi:hypothetical protein